MEPRLQLELATAELTLRRARLWRDLSLCWLVIAAVVLLGWLAQWVTGWTSRAMWLLPLVGGLVATVVIFTRHEKRVADFKALVAAMEHDFPELRHLLSAAAEQRPGENGFGFLQLRVVDEVLAHPQRALWKRQTERKLAVAKSGGLAAMAVGVFAMVMLAHTARKAHSVFGAVLPGGVTVTPGDATIERGSSLVVAARFGSEPPSEAALVVVSAAGKTQRLPLERHLADPVYGASLVEVREDGQYHVEYPGGKTPEYKIHVFDYPSLVRADASLVYPTYTGLTNKTIPDTRRISAITGTQLTYNFQLNKPVKHARLVSGATNIDLTIVSNATALLNAYTLTNSGKFLLALEDAEGRTNKFPSDFIFQVQTNRRPIVKVVSPRGDQRVSRLEELQLRGEASGEFGLVKYGIGFGIAGQNPKLVELGGGAASKQKAAFNYMIPLENMNLDEDQVVGYFVWADDIWPDGRTRRTMSDIYFAEIRPFDEIFRQDQSGAGDDSDQGSQGQKGGQGNEDVKLVELQRDIVVATWKLQQNGAP